MSDGLQLLNRILATSQPHHAINLPLQSAHLLAALSPTELGTLAGAIERDGVVAALETCGLFGRTVRVVDDDRQADFSIEKERAHPSPMRWAVGHPC
jgi:hypothetical protein